MPKSKYSYYRMINILNYWKKLEKAMVRINDL